MTCGAWHRIVAADGLVMDVHHDEEPMGVADVDREEYPFEVQRVLEPPGPTLNVAVVVLAGFVKLHQEEGVEE